MEIGVEPRLRVQELREQRGWRREQLSTESGVPYPTISRIESDHRVSLGTLIKLAKALGVGLDDLVALE